MKSLLEMWVLQQITSAEETHLADGLTLK